MLFRIFHYPPAGDADADEWGVGEHTDYGLLTILCRTTPVACRSQPPSAGSTRPAEPGAFVCNIGDMLDR